MRVVSDKELMGGMPETSSELTFAYVLSSDVTCANPFLAIHPSAITTATVASAPAAMSHGFWASGAWLAPHSQGPI